jgi:hypothetical protein
MVDYRQREVKVFLRCTERVPGILCVFDDVVAA